VERTRIGRSDGRVLDVVEVGDPGGIPVLAFHGTPTGPLEVLGSDELAREVGVRLVCAARPGYAATSPARPALSSAVDDARAALDGLGITRAGVLGVSGGGPYAAALATTSPDRTTGLALLAGAGPLAVEQWTDDPDSLEERRAVDLALAGRVGDAGAIIRELVGRFVAHLAGNADLPVPQHVRAAALDGASGGHEGPVFDRLATAVGWDAEISAVSCPTRLFYGGADAAVPPAHGAWYLEQVPHAVLDVVPEADHPGTISAGYRVALPWLAALG
jgi:pimeloyl-ACP methyl ester carboxylesterase